MGNNQLEQLYFNEFAVVMMSNKIEPDLQTVKKLSQAVFELKQMDKRSKFGGEEMEFTKRRMKREQER